MQTHVRLTQLEEAYLLTLANPQTTQALYQRYMGWSRREAGLSVRRPRPTVHQPKNPPPTNLTPTFYLSRAYNLPQNHSQSATVATVNVKGIRDGYTVQYRASSKQGPHIGSVGFGRHVGGSSPNTYTPKELRPRGRDRPQK